MALARKKSELLASITALKGNCENLGLTLEVKITNYNTVIYNGSKSNICKITVRTIERVGIYTIFNKYCKMRLKIIQSFTKEFAKNECVSLDIKSYS